MPIEYVPFAIAIVSLIATPIVGGIRKSHSLDNLFLTVFGIGTFASLVMDIFLN